MGYYTSSALSAIQHDIHEQSLSEGANENGLTATVVLNVPFANRWDVVNDIVGNGLVYAREPFSRAYAKSASIETVGGQGAATGQFPSYQRANVTINYEVGGEEDDGVDVFAESLEPSAEFITLDYTKFRWTDDDGALLVPEEAPGFLIVGFDYVQTEYQRTTIPNSALTELGNCNSAAVAATLLGLTFAAQTLMFATSQPSRTIKSDGTYTWTWTKRFSYRKNGWNKFYRAATGTWEPIWSTEESAVHESYLPSTLPIV